MSVERRFPIKPLLMLVAVSVFLSAPASATNRLEIAGGEIEVYVEESLLGGDPERWLDWIETASRAVSRVSGEFPEARLKVRLTSSGARYPVTFGSVRRSRPPEIRMQVHPDADLPDLLDDWHSFHEFAHLLLPFAGNRDIWFAEGLAAYYQHLLQVRAGVISPEEGWRRLFAGFQRGINDPNGRGTILRDLSPNMWRERAFRRIHWTGASFFLRVDLKLRQASGGEHSLDSALAAFARCCRRADRAWNARRLVDQLGELSLPQVWRQEYERAIDAEAVPNLEWSMNRLGIEWQDQTIRFSDSPDDQRRRAALFSGPPTVGANDEQ